MVVIPPFDGARVESIGLRPVTPTDEPVLHEVFLSTRDDLAALPEAIRTQLVAMQYQAHVAHRTQNFPQLLREMIVVDGESAGYLFTSFDGTWLTIVDIALRPGARKQGVGRSTLRWLLSRMPAVRLQVDERNPARRLYERLGFRVVERSGPILRMEAISAESGTP